MNCEHGTAGISWHACLLSCLGFCSANPNQLKGYSLIIILLLESGLLDAPPLLVKHVVCIHCSLLSALIQAFCFPHITGNCSAKLA